MAWASTACAELPVNSSGGAAGKRALRPDAVTRSRRHRPRPGPDRRVKRCRRAGWPPAGDQEHVQKQLHPVLRQQRRGKIPDELRLVVLEQAARHLFGIAEVDLGTGRAGRAEGDAAELQLGRGGRALFLIRSIANALVSSSLSSSITSRPLTIAPTGLIRSWQTREHSSAARSRASMVTRHHEVSETAWRT